MHGGSLILSRQNLAPAGLSVNSIVPTRSCFTPKRKSRTGGILSPKITFRDIIRGDRIVGSRDKTLAPTRVSANVIVPRGSCTDSRRNSREKRIMSRKTRFATKLAYNNNTQRPKATWNDANLFRGAMPTAQRGHADAQAQTWPLKAVAMALKGSLAAPPSIRRPRFARALRFALCDARHFDASHPRHGVARLARLATELR
jgi:hypothetical protein